MIRCPACGFPGADVDEACGACGAPLAVLAVVGGRVRVDERTEAAEVTIENRGRRPASFVLRSSDARSFPAWLIGFPDLDRATEIAPGAHATVRFLVDGARLPHPAQAANGARAAGRVVVPLVTSMTRWDEEARHGVRRVLAVELATAGRPVASPGLSSFRFIARGLVEGGRAIARTIHLRNDGGHPLSLVSATLAPLDVTIARGAVLLAPEAMIQLAPITRPEVIEPGGTFALDVRLRLLPDRLPARTLGVFGAQVTLSFGDGERARAVVRGVVGDGPTVAAPASANVSTGGRPARLSVEISNPGAVPVRVRGLSVVPAPDEASAPDWLYLADAEAPTSFVLAPDERRAVALMVDPERRSSEALERPWGRAMLRVRHDGWDRGDDGEGHQDIVIVGELGRQRTLESATLGVDFGTSNSSASLFFGPTASLIPLAIDRAAAQESMASLLFFVGERERDFLFGKAADHAAPLAWQNLVRNLKTVVARELTTRWHFVQPSTGQLAATWSTQQLLDRFVVELKRRAEDGLRALPTAQLAALGLVDTGVRFKHAVFSHPVGADEATIAALFAAAQGAGLAEGVRSQLHFADTRCIDEASAAVIAWVHVTAAQPDAPAADEERLLCFDIGGGTTDVAAVLVRGLAAFKLAPGAHVVEVDLRAAGGDTRFGGTDIDRVTAGLMLDDLARRAELGALEIEEVRKATFFVCYDAYRRARGHIVDAAADADAPPRTRAIFGRAADVLRAAERAKVQLCEAGAAERVSWVPPLDDWPLVAGRARPQPTRVETVLSREAFHGAIKDRLGRAAALVPPVIADAGWRPDDVTTVLFTGQTSRMAALRDAVLAALAARRTPGAPPLRVVAPGTLPGFDPKRCVAQGAAVWGDSTVGGGGWLRVSRRSREALAGSFQVRRGPLLIDVDGLAAGARLPARGTLTFSEPQRSVSLYRNGQLAFAFDLPVAANQVDIVVDGEHRAGAIVEGVRVEGRRP